VQETDLGDERGSLAAVAVKKRQAAAGHGGETEPAAGGKEFVTVNAS
jgi:hypothetical protein